MELNVLVEAKKEYLGQLCMLMCPVMIQSFQRMYEEAQKLSKGRKVLIQYQKLLKEVPNWNDHIVKSNSDDVCNTCSWFSDLIAAVFVSFVKILSSVRLKTDNKKISIKLPTNDLFVHTCYINAARELYKDPFIFDEEINEYIRDSKLSTRFTTCIEATIKELLPIQQILETYMKQQPGSDSVDLNTEEPVEDTEDPDIMDDEPTPMDQPETEPEPTDQPDPAPAAPTDAEPAPAPETAQEEVKQIPISGGQQHDDVLFPDAPPEKQKVVT
jgi:hypothetical protein